MFFFHFGVSYACKKLAIMMISLLTWTWRLTDVVCKFSYSTFDKALYRYPSREIYEFTSICSKFIEVMCAKIYLSVRSFWQSYCKKNKILHFLGYGVTITVNNTSWCMCVGRRWSSCVQVSVDVTRRSSSSSSSIVSGQLFDDTGQSMVSCCNQRCSLWY